MDGLALSAAECDFARDGGRTLSGLSLCAGAGGLDLGLHLAIPGYRTVGYVERETYAAATLVARMEDKALDCAPVWDDVATFDGKPWRGLVDIIHGGYPCQPFSVAGRKLGDKDPRHLWPHIARIVGEVQPALCFCENVGGHLRLGFEQVHDDLQQMGYRVKAGLFTAEEVGAPHKRERLFILAYAEGAGERRETENLSGTQQRPNRSLLRFPDSTDGHVADGDSFRCERDPRPSTGKDDPQRRSQCPAHPVAGGNGAATERLSLYKTGLGTGAEQPALSPSENSLADAAGAGAGQQCRDSRQGIEGNGNASLVDANGAGLEGWRDHREPGGDAEQPFPPGPSDKAGWERLLRERPDLEPSVRGGSDGLACRVDRLRLCGNGVVPLVAAYAFRTLATAANIGT